MKKSNVAWVSGGLFLTSLLVGIIFTNGIQEKGNEFVRDMIKDKRTDGEKQLIKDLDNAYYERAQFNKEIEQRAGKAIAESEEITKIDAKIDKKKSKDPNFDCSELRKRKNEIIKSLKDAEFAKEAETVKYYDFEVHRLQKKVDNIYAKERKEFSEYDKRDTFIATLIDSDISPAFIRGIGVIPAILGFVAIIFYYLAVLQVAKEMEEVI